MQKNIYIDYKTFKNLPFEDVVKPSMTYYQNLGIQKEFQDFQKLAIEYNIDGTSFQEEIEKKFNKYWVWCYENILLTLSVVSIPLLICNNKASVFNE